MCLNYMNVDSLGISLSFGQGRGVSLLVAFRFSKSFISKTKTVNDCISGIKKEQI
ncbi:MAG: hypothetical protein LBD98_00140 [Endomicrobium sp.]|nr:hypothetical protein [Endomicrobium sp.]